MTLHAVTQKDSGLYRCEVSAPADHTNLGEINVTLNVLGKSVRACGCVCEREIEGVCVFVLRGLCAVVSNPILLPQCPPTPRPVRCPAQFCLGLG